jgi:hypothetical protein
MPRYFTREEAESLLPLLTEILIDMQAQKARLDELQSRSQEIASKASGNGHVLNGQTRNPGPEIERLTKALTVGFERLKDLGVELKGIEQGLLDFLGTQDGRDIYLCWQLGEERITFWHEINTGFAGRQPLDD